MKKRDGLTRAYDISGLSWPIYAVSRSPVHHLTGPSGIVGLQEKPRPGRAPVFPPDVALYVVKLACERPDQVGVSLSQWDYPKLARKLKADGLVQNIAHG